MIHTSAKMSRDTIILVLESVCSTNVNPIWVEPKQPQITSTGRANVGPTFEEWLGRHRPYNVGPTSIGPSAQRRRRRADVGATLGQHSATVGAMLSWCLGNFLPTFGRPFINLWLLIFPRNVLQIKHNFWCLEDVQRILYFKAYFGTCPEAWHSMTSLRQCFNRLLPTLAQLQIAIWDCIKQYSNSTHMLVQGEQFVRTA